MHSVKIIGISQCSFHGENAGHLGQARDGSQGLQVGAESGDRGGRGEVWGNVTLRAGPGGQTEWRFRYYDLANFESCVPGVLLYNVGRPTRERNWMWAANARRRHSEAHIRFIIWEVTVATE